MARKKEEKKKEKKKRRIRKCASTKRICKLLRGSVSICSTQVILVLLPIWTQVAAMLVLALPVERKKKKKN